MREEIVKLTDEKYLNLYKKGRWIFTSRKTELDSIEIDAVVIIPILSDEKKLVMVSQFRPSVNKKVLEFPAGLVDEGEDFITAAARELFEETNLTISKIRMVRKNVFSSAGLTDENIAVVVADVSGTISNSNIEEAESENELQVLAFSFDELEDILGNNSTAIGARDWPFVYLAILHPEFLK